MRNRRIAWIVGVVLVGAPLPLVAREDVTPGTFIVGRAETRATVGGLEVAALVIPATGSATLAVSARNPTTRPVRTTVEVEVYQRAEVSPMARMVPRPRLVGRQALEFRLGAGETARRPVSLTITPSSNPKRAKAPALYPLIRTTAAAPARPARQG
jgi:hypothetical protein